TSPPMRNQIARYEARLAEHLLEAVCTDSDQALSEEELIRQLPRYDAWIIGDDPATERVLAAGKAGKLRAAVRWGVGADNVDFEGARRVGVKVENTPDMFGDEIADLIMHYVVALARETFQIHAAATAGEWSKRPGVSLKGKTVALVGYGSVGREAAVRLLAAKMRLQIYTRTPRTVELNGSSIDTRAWPDHVEAADFIVLCCPLTPQTHHLLGRDFFAACQRGVRIVNVARGSVIDEPALIEALHDGHVHSAALDVFETEPLPADSPLRSFPQVILGSHNASNTIEAVDRTTHRVIELIAEQLAEAVRP
ncbi:MAG: NAD(P)-dependent oxidoreductase, partial [Planctomycetota bacterium]